MMVSLSFYQILCFAAVFFFGLYVWFAVLPRGRVRPEGRTVVVTGCDTGFGELLALDLDGLGMRVFALCLTQSGADALTEKASSNLTTLVCDITSDDDVEAAADAVADACPDGVWAVVNNAGISGPMWPIEFLTMDNYKQVMDVNCIGHIRVTKAFIPHLKKGRGRFVNMVSVAGMVSGPRMSAYCASKFAMEGFSDALRAEMAPFGVSVAIIEPGFMKTPLVTGITPERIRAEWDRYDSELTDAYGESFLKHTIDNSVKIVSNAGDPMVTVAALRDAVLSISPRPRYRVGKEGNKAVVATHVPTVVGDFLKQFLLPYPTPESARRR